MRLEVEGASCVFLGVALCFFLLFKRFIVICVYFTGKLNMHHCSFRKTSLIVPEEFDVLPLQLHIVAFNVVKLTTENSERV